MSKSLAPLPAYVMRANAKAALDAMVDTVLAYRPKSKQPKPRKRKKAKAKRG